MKKIVSTSDAPAAIGPYSQAIRSGSMLFCAGQIPLDPRTGQIVSDDISEQTRRVLENISAILKAENLSFGHVVKTTIFLISMGDFQTVNEIYATYFREDPPAITSGSMDGVCDLIGRGLFAVLAAVVMWRIDPVLMAAAFAPVVAGALVRSGTAQEAKAITGEAPRWTQGTRHRRVAAGNGGLRSRQGGFTQFARPVFPAPVAARMERAALGLPPGFAPRRPRAGRRTPGSGTGHRARTWTTRSTHISRSPIGSARFRPT